MVRHVAARRVPVVLLVCVVAVLLSRASSRGESAMGMARGWGRGSRGGGEGPFYRGYLTLTLTLTCTPSSWCLGFRICPLTIVRLQRFKVVLRVPTQAERAAHAELLLRRLPRHALAIRCGTKQAVPAAAATTGAATEKRA